MQLCTRLAARLGIILGLGLGAGACSLTWPMFALSGSSAPDPAMTTASIPARPPVSAPQRGQPSLSDHLGPEDIRRANGAMALALDPQGNGAPVSWDNVESKSAGRFTPVGGPFLKDDEVCRAFLTQIATAMDKHALQGTACRPSGGEWAIRDLKLWKQPG
ncbi:MAG: RT0821/Lpp0805 family surface protein [Bosea sp. (in: a-proteobacteria)]